MRELLQVLKAGLEEAPTLEVEPAVASAPFVYVTAIRSEAGLVRSLAGITLLSRELGFGREAETLYSQDGRSATFHALHDRHAVALAVEVCPPRQTVSIAVSGSNNAETYGLFLEVDARLFGPC